MRTSWRRAAPSTSTSAPRPTRMSRWRFSRTLPSRRARAARSRSGTSGSRPAATARSPSRGSGTTVGFEFSAGITAGAGIFATPDRALAAVGFSETPGVVFDARCAPRHALCRAERRLQGERRGQGHASDRRRRQPGLRRVRRRLRAERGGAPLQRRDRRTLRPRSHRAQLEAAAARRRRREAGAGYLDPRRSRRHHRRAPRRQARLQLQLRARGRACRPRRATSG